MTKWCLPPFVPDCETFIRDISNQAHKLHYVKPYPQAEWFACRLMLANEHLERKICHS